MDALYPNPAMSNNWRASLVPAAAVIPAPRAYTNIVAVKKLVVDPRAQLGRAHAGRVVGLVLQPRSACCPLRQGSVCGFEEEGRRRKEGGGGTLACFRLTLSLSLSLSPSLSHPQTAFSVKAHGPVHSTYMRK